MSFTGRCLKRWGFWRIEIQWYDDHMISFFGERIETSGYIDLYTTFGEGKHLCWTIKIRHSIAEANTFYNIFVGEAFSQCPSGNSVDSTPHHEVFFHVRGHSHGDQKVTRECYVTILRVDSTNRERSWDPHKECSCEPHKEHF